VSIPQLTHSPTPDPIRQNPSRLNVLSSDPVSLPQNIALGVTRRHLSRNGLGQGMQS
jgi:hypothetical protein